MASRFDPWRDWARDAYSSAPEMIKKLIKERAAQQMDKVFPNVSKTSRIGQKVYANLIMIETLARCGLKIPMEE